MRQPLRPAPTVAVRADRRQSEATNLRLLVWRDAALDVQRQRNPRTDLAPDPRWIARHVHQGAQERRDTHVLKRRRDLLVVIGKRLTGVGVSSRSRSPNSEQRPSDQNDVLGDVLVTPVEIVGRSG